MKRTLALAAVAILVAACAGMSPSDAGMSTPDAGMSTPDAGMSTSGVAVIDGPGAAVAASLGYHGPLHRAYTQYGN